MSEGFVKPNELIIKKYLQPNERLDDLQYKNLHIIQHPQKYCFTSDAVALANFVKAKVQSKVVDLCSGSGVIGILVQAKTGASNVVLVEIQNDLSFMSERSIKLNGLQNKIKVVNSPLQNIHKKIGCESYDVVVCNPPYKNASLLNQKSDIAMCKHEITVSLEEIISEAAKLLKFGGYFYICNKEERLSDIICYLRKYGMEAKIIKIISSLKGSAVVLVQAKKGGKSGVKLLLA